MKQGVVLKTSFSVPRYAVCAACMYVQVTIGDRCAELQLYRYEAWLVFIYCAWHHWLTWHCYTATVALTSNAAEYGINVAILCFVQQEELCADC